MTLSKSYSEAHGAHSSCMERRVRAAQSDQRTVVEVGTDVKRKSANATKLESPFNDGKQACQGERSFKSVLLSKSAVEAPRIQSRENDCPSKCALSASSQQMHKGFSSAVSGLESSLRARWSDLSDAMADCSEAAGPWESSTTDADTTSVSDSSTTASHKEGSPEETPRAGFPGGTLEEHDCPENPFTYVAPDHCGVCTPDLQEEQEPYVYDPHEWEVGGAWCSWMPTFTSKFAAPGELNVAVADGGWYSAVVPSQDQAQQGADESDGIVGDAFKTEASGDVTSSSMSSSTTWAVTGWMPVVTMVEVSSTVQPELGAAAEEDPSKDNIKDRLIDWKHDSAWSQDECGHAAMSSHLDWDIAFGEFDPSGGEFDPSSQGNLDKYSRAHYVQAVKAFQNARNMQKTMFEDHFSATWDSTLDDGTATTASVVDASSSLESLDSFVPGQRAPVHSKVPRSRNFAQEHRHDEEEITTLMIRNIPNRYKRNTLIRELDSLGLTGTYDFLYIPVDRGTSWNVGYAFVNFVSPEFAADCLEKLHGHVFLQNKSIMPKVAQVSIAHMQGYERNVQHYKNCAVFTARESQRPLILEEESSRDLEDSRSRVIDQERFL